jgi:hypothetical protein
MGKQCNVIIYRIYCATQNDCKNGFIGHTINLSQKKHYHKVNCVNTDNICSLYTAIRENGGWKNWRTDKLDVLPITSDEEIQKIENSYNEQFSYTLSTEQNRHYFCTLCSVECLKKNDYERHCQTQKHKKLRENKEKHQLELQLQKKDSQIQQQEEQLRQQEEQLHVHGSTKQVDLGMVMDVLKKNNDLTTQIIELSKEKNITTTSNSHNNINNKFNLNVFLNETCKDAINLADFVSQMSCKVEDLVHTGEAGFSDGISEILMRNLRSIATNRRPIHCSDVKRETLYIRENNAWEKDDARTQLMNVVRQIARSNLRNLEEWKESHPHYYDYESKQNTEYMQIVGNAMPGATDDEIEHNYKKIIRNIAQSVPIPKHIS